MASETDVGTIWGGFEGLKSATLDPRCAYKRACDGKRNTMQNQAVSADALRNHPDRLLVRGGGGGGRPQVLKKKDQLK